MRSPISASTSAPTHSAYSRTLTDWTRLAGHYANLQEVQKACPVSSWRLEEAMYRLLGRGYENDRGYAIDRGYQGALR